MFQDVTAHLIKLAPSVLNFRGHDGIVLVLSPSIFNADGENNWVALALVRDRTYRAHSLGRISMHIFLLSYWPMYYQLYSRLS